MGIKRYKRFEDAERDLWKISLGKNNLKDVFTIFRLRGLKNKCPRGIFKYKTIQDAMIDAEKWLKETI